MIRMTMTGKSAPVVKIRRARSSDVARLAELSGELGYPATAAQIARRLNQLKPASRHAVLVAESRESGSRAKVIGWLHVSVDHLLEVAVRAEVNGLVVGEGRRGLGAGTKLLEAGEKWARSRGCREMHVRSNVIRERAHAFYQRNGYDHYKTQKAFRKPL